jgi:roadblock/LC7 domain-containing protein
VPQELTSLADIDVQISSGALDAAGNVGTTELLEDFFDVNVIVSVSESGTDRTLVVYPNPSTNGQAINVEWSELPAELDISVFNNMGQMVSNTFTKVAGSQRIQIETADFSQGMYHVRISSTLGTNMFTVSIVK